MRRGGRGVGGSGSEQWMEANGIGTFSWFEIECERAREKLKTKGKDSYSFQIKQGKKNRLCFKGLTESKIKQRNDVK